MLCKEWGYYSDAKVGEFRRGCSKLTSSGLPAHLLFADRVFKKKYFQEGIGEHHSTHFANEGVALPLLDEPSMVLYFIPGFTK